MNRKHFPYFYFLFSITFLIIFYVIDDLAMARFLGATSGIFFDNLFLTFLILGFYLALKFDVMIASIIVSILYSLIAFIPISDWQKEIGVYEGAISLVLTTTLRAFFPIILIYSLLRSGKNFLSKKPKINENE